MSFVMQKNYFPMNVLKTRHNLKKRRNSVDLEDAHVLDQSDPACRLERTCKLKFFVIYLQSTNFTLMNSNIYLDSKPRYEILDGLRGVAASGGAR